MSIINLVQTGIMAADLANSIVQTGIMFSELAESREANRLAANANNHAGFANQISKQQMQQDLQLTLLTMKHERELDEADEKLRRELNSNLVNELSKITSAIHGVEIAIRKDFE